MSQTQIDVNELNAKFDSAMSGIKNMQDVASRNKDKLEALDAEQFSRINDDVTKSLEKVNALQAKQDKLEEQNKTMEKMLCNISTSAKSDGKTRSREVKNAVTHLLRTGGSMSREIIEQNANEIVEKNYFGLSDADRRIIKKDFEVVSDPNGGYWVQHERLSQTVDRVFETSPMRQIAKIATTATDAVELIIDDELMPNGGWVGETQTRPGTDTNQIGLKKIYIHEIYAEPKATQKMLDDAGFDIESYIFDSIVESFSLTENTAFVTGDSIAKPTGFLTYDPWNTPGVYQRDKLEHLVSGTSATFDADDLKDLQNSLVDSYQNGAVWVMNRKTFGTVAKLKTTTNDYLLDPNSLKVGDTRVLLGNQVVFFSDMPDEASDSPAVAYGNFKRSYLIIDRIGIRMIRDVLTKKGYVKFYTTKRLGGDVVNFEGIKILQCAS